MGTVGVGQRQPRLSSIDMCTVASPVHPWTLAAHAPAALSVKSEKPGRPAGLQDLRGLELGAAGVCWRFLQLCCCHSHFGVIFEPRSAIQSFCTLLGVGLSHLLLLLFYFSLVLVQIIAPPRRICFSVDVPIISATLQPQHHNSNAAHGN